MRRALIAVLLPAVALAACAKPAAVAHDDLDALDAQLTEGGVHNEIDPAMAAALRDPIMIDPALAQQSNARAVRPPPRPDPGAMPPDDLGAPTDTSRAADQAPTPAARPGCPACAAARGALTLEALAERVSTKSVAACAAGIGYATIWSTRLPAALPLYPDARVAEAAGNDANGCALRVVSFASNASLPRISDWYTARLLRAGFAPDHRADGGDHLLGAARDEAAFLVYLRPHAGGGTDVDLVSNTGR